MIEPNSKPVIVRFDIETTPLIGYAYKIWEGNIIKVIKPWHMLSFAYQIEGEDEVHVVSLPDFKSRYKKDKTDDFELALALRNLLDKADIIIAHNGDRFDLRKANTRFIAHGIQPPSPVISIDTLKIARKYFAFDSNSLDSLGEFLGLGRKLKHEGFELTERCIAGDMSAWEIMCEYNKQDVVLLGRIYEVLKPWHRTHPNIATPGKINCPKCDSTKVQRRGYERTVAGTIYPRIKCNDCGAWSTIKKMAVKVKTK